MKQIPTAIFGLLIVFILAGCHTGRQIDSTKPYNLKLTGAPNTAFSGTLRENEKVRKISGVVPAEYQVFARKIDCIITQEGPGELVLDVMQGNQKVANYENGGSLKGIHFKVNHGWILNSSVVTGF